jgi:pentatricopeptide repeat protein
VKSRYQQDDNIYTVTMAEVYSSQGHFDKAIQIYRRLLEERPQEEALIEKLAESEKRLLEQQRNRKEDLVALFSQWMRLLEARQRLDAMEKLKRSLPVEAPGK